MIFVSEKPIYEDFSPIRIGTEVSIIEQQYVKFNPITFKEEVLERNEYFFRTGTLLARHDEIPSYYCVLLSNNDIVTFKESPREYFFRKK